MRKKEEKIDSTDRGETENDSLALESVSAYALF